MNQKQNLIWRMSVLLVIFLLLNLPLISALNLSDVRTAQVNETNADIIWTTDEPANSFVNYGLSQSPKENLQSVGDADKVLSHSIELKDLQPATEYQYSVRSNETVNNNEGAMYKFTTLALDTTAPAVVVEVPQYVRGEKLEVKGRTEIGTFLKLYVNNGLAGTTTALSVPGTNGGTTTVETIEMPGQFKFIDVQLKANEWNNLKVEVADRAGNLNVWESQVFADTEKPQLTLEKLPTILDKNTVELKGTISENISYEIKVNSNSAATGTGTLIQETLNLQEGSNEILVQATDLAGWESEEDFQMIVDTQPPSVTAEVERGTEYYQGRATSSINGKTESGATVYLYVFQPILGSERHPDFTRAWKKATADEKGEFTFEDVDFEKEPLTWEDFQPREVPSGLQDIVIFPTERVGEQERQVRYVYILAVDQSGKVSLAPWQTTISLETCFSANYDFNVQELTQFHAPLRLNPQLLDEGREVIQAVFNLSYRGTGQARVDIASGTQIDSPYKITNVDFEKACTQGSQEDEKVKLGCELLPRGNPRVRTSNTDRTSWYISYNLMSSKDFSQNNESFWDEFQKRQVQIPLKITVSYQDRKADGTYSEVKTVTDCRFLSYYVDIPIESKKMLPDFLTDEGLSAIEFTLDKIATVKPYLETAIRVTGVLCITSFLSRMAIRWARIFTSKMEAYSTRLMKDDDAKKCPLNQGNLHLASTLESWQKIQGKFNEPKSQLRDKDGKLIPPGSLTPEKVAALSLDSRCPNTANMWKVEATLDQAYRWTCDRVFCRAVPAGWTSSKDKAQVDTVILKQSQCTASSRGVPLTKRENCQELVKQRTVLTTSIGRSLIASGDVNCYQYGTRLYAVDPKDTETVFGDQRIIKLYLVDDLAPTIESALTDPSIQSLFAYRIPGSDQLIVGQDESCADACKNPRNPGYIADVPEGLSFSSGSVVFQPGPEEVEMTSSQAAGCYKEMKKGAGTTLFGNVGEIKGDKFSVGYTKDCFINPIGQAMQLATVGEGEETGLLQCVCTLDEKKIQRSYVAREAIKEQEGIVEDWDYRENELFKVDKRYGTYYPEWRYYKGRDFPSAFGADYLLDYLHDDQNKEVHQVNPNTQFLGAYQTLCLSRIHAQLVQLEAILQGLKACIQEAKVTGLHDAGVCKTMFTQHVCGLIYKAIAYFFTSCSPYSPGDSQEESLGGVYNFFQAGFSSVDEAMSSSINDIKSDYGNAKINEYFSSGTQGFAQSLCMFAFGYDWPLGMDFIEDAAYAVPGKTDVIVMPADRELSTYNPKTGTAIYNYNVGAMILPGCKIRSYDVYLKCAGPEDRNRPGVQCGAQGCDCMNVRNPTAFEGERIKYLDGGRGNDLQPNGFISVPIPSPQKIDAQFRYDHVVVKLNIDQYESADKCFDEGYRDGEYYFPIVDVSPPAVGVCQVDIDTGRYTCPEIAGLFGGGEGSYLEDPFVSCYDKNTGAFVSCDTPNLFNLGDEIKFKVHVYSSGKGECLKVSTTGVTPFGMPYSEPVKLYENLPGPFSPVISLGKVTSEMLTGQGSLLQIAPGSEGDCSFAPEALDASQPAPEGVSQVIFNYQIIGGSYTVTVPSGISIENGADYEIEATTNHLVHKSDKTGLTVPELREVIFNIKGFKVRNMIGSPQRTQGQCIYRFSTSSGSAATAYNSYSSNSYSSYGSSGTQNFYSQQSSIHVRAQLLQPDTSGQCFDSHIAVKPSRLGRSDYDTDIVIQKEPAISQVVSRMHQNLIQGNYNAVITQADQIVNRRQRDLEEAVALYYYAAAYIAQSEDKWPEQYGARVCNLLTVFKEGYSEEAGVKTGFAAGVENTGEYQKIKVYFGEMEKKLQANNIKCGVASGS